MLKVVLSGLSALRIAAWVWVATVLAISWNELLRPWLAVLLVIGALAYTVTAMWWVRVKPDRLLRIDVVSVELSLATLLVLCDGWAYGPRHAFSTSQSLGSVWPLVAVLSVGVVFGSGWGIASGVLLGAARVGATLANGVWHFDGTRVLSLVSTAVFYAVAGAVAGYLITLLRRAETEISAARAREEVARTLHDGVLQTLAIIERRAADEDLVRLAREQDRELRNYLFGQERQSAVTDLVGVLRRAADRFETTFGVRTQVLVGGELPKLDGVHVEALSKAVGEALTNVGKHAHAHRVVVFIEPDDQGRIFCSVKDDGRGFDPSADGSGVGIASSIVTRMYEVGGRAEIHSRPGEGTEVCLWT
jgi:signal transduction histidine kinase